MKKPWTTPTVTERDMTPDDYQRMNDILIRQASENEIYIAGLLARIRDLEAEVERLKALCPYETDTEKLAELAINKRNPKPMYFTRKWD